jgi:hypothetical protein
MAHPMSESGKREPVSWLDFRSQMQGGKLAVSSDEVALSPW